MGLDLRFVLTGAKRVFDRRPMYAQVVVTDACNLRCAYCDERAEDSGTAVPLAVLKERIDRLDRAGVLVYDFLGGEPLLHPDLPAVVSHAKSKRGGSNLVTVITNGFLLTPDRVRALNAAGLDYMQVSVDAVRSTPFTRKSLESVLPQLTLLATEARFKVEIQTVLSEETAEGYERLRSALEGFPFSLGFSLQHAPGGRVAVRGERVLELVERHGMFDGIDFYGAHLPELLRGDFSRRWKCLAGFKYLYLTADGRVQWCAQQREYRLPIEALEPRKLKSNDRHKPCEPGCAIGCARMVSRSLGEPVKAMRSSVALALAAARGRS